MNAQTERAPEISEKLVFVRSFLLLLQDTGLFGPTLVRAIDDLDDVIEATLR